MILFILLISCVKEGGGVTTTIKESVTEPDEPNSPKDSVEEESRRYLYEIENDKRGYKVFSVKEESFKPYRYGVVDRDGNEILKPIYDNVLSVDGESAHVRLDNRYFYVDFNGDEVHKSRYDYIYPYVDGVARVLLDKKYGFIDRDGNEILEPIYDKASNFSDGLAAVFLFDSTADYVMHNKDWVIINERYVSIDYAHKYGRWGFINRAGEFVIPIQYYEATPFYNDRAVVSKDGKTYIINRQGEQIAKLKESFNRLSFSQLQDGIIKTKYGDYFSNSNGEGLPIKRGYHSIGYISEGLIKVEIERGSYGFINMGGEEITTKGYKSVSSFVNGFAIVKGNESQYGFINQEGREICSLDYTLVDDFMGGFARVKKEYRWGFINSEGKLIAPLEYDLAFNFSEGRAVVQIGEKYAVIDDGGRAITKFEYDWIASFEEGHALVVKNGKHGFINRDGRVIIPLKYEWASSFKNGLAVVKLDGNYGDEYGFIDSSGKVVIPIHYDDANYFTEGLAPVKNGGKWGFIDKNSSVVIPFIYQYCYPFEKGFAAVKINDCWETIDREGNYVVLTVDEHVSYWGHFVPDEVEKMGVRDNSDKVVSAPAVFDGMNSYENGSAGASFYGKWGFVDSRGELLIRPKYDKVYYFDDGIAAVSVGGVYGYGGKWGFINDDGKEIIPLKYDHVTDNSVGYLEILGGDMQVYSFSWGLIRVCLDGKEGLLTWKGEVVLPPKYDQIFHFEGDATFVELNKKYGLINRSGKEIVAPKYDELKEFEDHEPFGDIKYFINGKALVRLGDKWLSIDQHGNEGSADEVVDDEESHYDDY